MLPPVSNKPINVHAVKALGNVHDVNILAFIRFCKFCKHVSIWKHCDIILNLKTNVYILNPYMVAFLDSKNYGPIRPIFLNISVAEPFDFDS